MKYSYKIKGLRALNRFNRSCQKHKIKYFSIKIGAGLWRGETENIPPLEKWDGIECFEIVSF